VSIIAANKLLALRLSGEKQAHLCALVLVIDGDIRVMQAQAGVQLSPMSCAPGRPQHSSALLLRVFMCVCGGGCIVGRARLLTSCISGLSDYRRRAEKKRGRGGDAALFPLKAAAKIGQFACAHR
jgi:hypothetical protein